MQQKERRTGTEPGQDRKGTGSKDKRTGTETWTEDRTEAKREGLIDRKWADAVACLERETDTVRHLFLAFGCDICGFLLYC